MNAATRRPRRVGRGVGRDAVDSVPTYTVYSVRGIFLLLRWKIINKKSHIELFDQTLNENTV